jgi:hypothetical protein
VNNPEDLEKVCSTACDKVRYLEIRDIGAVRDLRSFRGISVEETLFIRGNEYLQSTEGITLKDDARLSLKDNSSLRELEGMSSVKNLQSLTFEGNNELTSLGSLQNLARVGGDESSVLWFWQTSIQDFSALDGIEIKEGTNVLFQTNAQLTTLPQLEGKAAYVTLTNNKRLTDVSGLLGLDKLYQVDVGNNPNLPRCHVEEVVDQLEFYEESNRPIIIQGNGSGDCAN